MIAVFKERVSSSYVFTTDDRNHPIILNLRKSLKGTPYRVKLRGRGAKVKKNNRQYDFGGNVVGGLDNAKNFDVYVYERGDVDAKVLVRGVGFKTVTGHYMGAVPKEQ